MHDEWLEIQRKMYFKREREYHDRVLKQFEEMRKEIELMETLVQIKRGDDIQTNRGGEIIDFGIYDHDSDTDTDTRVKTQR